MEWFYIIFAIIASLILSYCVVKRQRKDLNVDAKKAKKNSYKKLFAISWLVPILSSAALIAIIAMVMRANENTDTEYLSYYLTKIQYEEPWDERVKTDKINTKSDKEKEKMSRNERNEDYLYKTVSHPAKWTGITNTNKTVEISEEEFTRIKALWNTPEVFIDKHRNYYKKDGNAYEHSWNNQDNTMICYTQTQPYKNKLLNSESAFSFKEFTPEEKEKLGLLDYPEVQENGVVNPIIGYNKFITQADIDTLRFFNAKYGASNQIQTFLLVFTDKSAAIAEDQRAYWQGGNKNEFVTCVGIDPETNKVNWVNCFSWLDNSSLEANCRNFLMKDSTLNIQSYYKFLVDNIDQWKRKEFKDFDYISTELNADHQLTIALTILIWNLVFGFCWGRFILKIY